ncbi:hypothetical protein IW261DRAFT_1555383 [Armillaria novae-zelandiae]|uniref:Uncharacterized protein n=1 Tax=Armillaria novae-zelandiae TaxID=153914 RepID=A0AA39URX2_9AGAR|nr:hypothetical protein IW261DRAFT_1555383 [Armillaria novae-zelandiae]
MILKVTRVDNYENAEEVAAIRRANRTEVVICSRAGFPFMQRKRRWWRAVRRAFERLSITSLVSDTGSLGDRLTDGANRAYEGVWAPNGEDFHWYIFQYLSAGKINVVGAGKTPGDGGFVAHVLTILPPAELKDKIFRIEDERLSWEDTETRVDAAITRAEKVPTLHRFAKDDRRFREDALWSCRKVRGSGEG